MSEYRYSLHRDVTGGLVGHKGTLHPLYVAAKAEPKLLVERATWEAV